MTVPLRNLPTWPDQILPLIEAQLVAAGLATADYIYLSTNPDEPPEAMPQDYFYEIVLNTQRPIQGEVSGGGTALPGFRGEFAVIIWNRLNVDQEGRDDAWLLDPNLGILQKLRGVCMALYMFDPVNSTPAYYLQEPMRLTDGGWLTKKRTSSTGFGSAAAAWEFQYIGDLTTPLAIVPTVTGLSVAGGGIAGGTAVTITGLNFLAGATVAFGAAAANSVVVVNATTITCVSPAHAAGLVDVTVTTTAGTSLISRADLFVYS